MKAVAENLTIRDFEAKKPGWCPGCGDYGIYAALRNAFVQLGLHPEQIVLVGGIGCSGKITDYIRTYSIHTLHGRILPVATGIKLANPHLVVIGVGGDGDAYAIGMSHLIHTGRRNPDITYIVMDNEIYGLTKGQASPTSEPGMMTPASPYGSKESAVDGVSIALSAGATFVARGFAGNPKELAEIIARAIQHKGFSFVDALSPCVTFNRINTYDWFRERIVPFPEKPDGYTRDEALAQVLQIRSEGKFPTGIIYEEEAPSYEEEVLADPEHPIAHQDLTPKPEFWDLLKRYQ